MTDPFLVSHHLKLTISWVKPFKVYHLAGKHLLPLPTFINFMTKLLQGERFWKLWKYIWILSEEDIGYAIYIFISYEYMLNWCKTHEMESSIKKKLASNYVIILYNRSVLESKYKSWKYNNDVRGRIIGDSERCQNSIMETMSNVKIRLTS